MDLSLPFMLFAFLMCGALLHHITVLAVRNEQKKNPFISQYIAVSLVILWFTPLYLSIKLAVFFGAGQYGLVIWLFLFAAGLAYVIRLTEKERKLRQNGHPPVDAA